MLPILGYIIAFFLPPLGAYGRAGVGKELLKNIILTFFFPVIGT